VEITEVARGIHRIESDLGERFMCQYLLVGPERVLLVDTGLAGTPREVLEPAFAQIGARPTNVLISHADLDHCGGDRAFRELNQAARIVCGAEDRRWIESNDAMLRENYLWHEAYGFPEPDEAGRRELLAQLGGDQPVDETLRGGERLRLGDDWEVEILHLPGHTYGHLGLWDARSRTAIAIDAVLYDGIYDRSGNKLIPPRIYTLDGYRATIEKLRALDALLLLTAHYPVVQGREVEAFLDVSRAWADRVEEIARDGVAEGVTGLWPLTERVNERLGPYPEFTTEIGALVRDVVERV
jgi:glyoxylase-like metal-dependent hydrolase (beta-lactamase superfamily II)